MKNFVKIAIAAAALVAPLQSQAATGDVIFNATVDNSCTISGIQSGSLGAGSGNTVLSSANTGTGGAAGGATVTTTSAAFAVSVDAPTGWDAGSVANPATNFVASVTGYAPGTIGASTVAVNLAATKATGSYASGAYQATVVLRCE